MKKDISIKIIEDNDLCISCGSCTHICPFDNILMHYIDNRGKYDAVVTNEDVCLKCNGQKNCLAVCPSYNVDYEGLANSSKNNFLGKIENIYNGYSQDKTIRLSASSGGFIRSFAKELLDAKEIDGIISITHDEGLDYTPKIIKDVSEMPNSIYHNVNYENAISLLKESEGKYLLIGLPCQITSIEQFLRKKRYKFLDEKIYLKIALICGYTFDRINMEFFSQINGFEMNKITYRENGRYRKTRISNDKKTKLFDVYNPVSINDRINNSIMFDKFLPQKHCLYCVDHLGYCADIVVGDAWQSRYINDKVGTNIIIARTVRGDNSIKKLERLVLEKGYISEIEESQHIYSKPFLGLNFAENNFFKDEFIVQHIVSNSKNNYKKIKFSTNDKIKIIWIKKILRKKHFKQVKYLYILLEFKLIVKLIIKKLIRRKI